MHLFSWALAMCLIFVTTFISAFSSLAGEPPDKPSDEGSSSRSALHPLRAKELNAAGSVEALLTLIRSSSYAVRSP